MSAKIKVLGIGGAGNNVVNRMVGVVNGVEFVAVNTDTQDLAESRADINLGSGGAPSIGQRSACKFGRFWYQIWHFSHLSLTNSKKVIIFSE